MVWFLQLHLVDGALLRSNPALVMDGIQRFLGVTPIFNYTQALLLVTHTHTHTHTHTQYAERPMHSRFLLAHGCRKPAGKSLAKNTCFKSFTISLPLSFSLSHSLSVFVSVSVSLSLSLYDFV